MVTWRLGKPTWALGAIPMYSYVFLCIPMGSIGIPGNLEAGQAYLGSHGNTWAAIGTIGILGDL